MNRGLHARRAVPPLCVYVLTDGKPGGCEGTLAALDRLSANIRGMQVLLFDNARDEDYRKARRVLRKRAWIHYRAPSRLSPDTYLQWVYSSVHKNHRAKLFIQLHEGQIPGEHLLTCASATWEAAGPNVGGISLIGSEIRPEGNPATFEAVVPAPDLNRNFITAPAGMEILGTWAPEHGKVEAVFEAKKLSVLRVHRSLVNSVLAGHRRMPVRPPPRPRPVPRVQVAPQQPRQPAPVRSSPGVTRHAAFLMATANRPHLLDLALRSLQAQRIPPGWQMHVLVSGEPDDKGAEVVAQFKGVRYIPVRSNVVTDKLNSCLMATDAELIMAADDDDLQPENRMEMAVRLHDEGADWSGTGLLYFYDVPSGNLMEWHGEAQKGLVGTSMSFRGSVLRKAGGWPTRRKGKDGPMARRVRGLSPTPRFRPLPTGTGPFICLQHGNNLWRRPVVEKGQRSMRGGFVIRGLGDLQDLDFVPGHVKRALAALPRG